MTKEECIKICRLVAAMCPQQKFDAYTPIAWSMVIGDLRFDDAQQAVVEAAKVSAFISPADIIKQIKVLEDARLREFGGGACWGDVGQPPFEIADDGPACAAWARQRMADIKSGVLTRENDPLRELAA